MQCLARSPPGNATIDTCADRKNRKTIPESKHQNVLSRGKISSSITLSACSCRCLAPLPLLNRGQRLRQRFSEASRFQCPVEESGKRAVPEGESHEHVSLPLYLFLHFGRALRGVWVS